MRAADEDADIPPHEVREEEIGRVGAEFAEILGYQRVRLGQRLQEGPPLQLEIFPDKKKKEIRETLISVYFPSLSKT